MLAYSASDGSAASFDSKSGTMLASIFFSSTAMTMTMTMPSVLCGGCSARTLSEVILGQDRVTNAKFLRPFAVSSY